MDDLREKIGELNAKAKAAHARLDKLETDIRSDLKEIMADVKELNAYMHRGKGWASALLLFSGFLGAGMFKLLTTFFK